MYYQQTDFGLKQLGPFVVGVTLLLIYEKSAFLDTRSLEEFLEDLEPREISVLLLLFLATSFYCLMIGISYESGFQSNIYKLINR